MPRLAMLRLRTIVPVRLDKYEARGILSLLQTIELRDARFPPAFVRIGRRGLRKCLDKFRFNSNVNMNDKHTSLQILLVTVIAILMFSNLELA